MALEPGRFSVVVVEDEVVVRMDLERSLARLGLRVVGSTGSALEAVRLAKELRPDLVLLDVRLRGSQDGIWVATELHAEMDVAVVFLTAHGDEATVARANQSGPRGYLVKPIDGAELARVVETALESGAKGD